MIQQLAELVSSNCDTAANCVSPSLTWLYQKILYQQHIGPAFCSFSHLFLNLSDLNHQPDFGGDHLEEENFVRK